VICLHLKSLRYSAPHKSLVVGRLAMESQRPDALIKDEKVVALATQMDSDFSRIKQIKMDEGV
jgi:O-methyltransferase involved in polyketide biosynthesis